MWGQSDNSEGDRIPATLFGMHMHHLVEQPPQVSTKTPWPAVSFSTWRLWDAYVAWSNLEPKKGEWNFKTLDKYLELAKKHQVEILLPLALSPKWASARPQEPSAYGSYSGAAAEPKNIEDWRNYVRTVATRYKGRIHYYELWNEANWYHYFTGTIDQMLELSREAYQILKEVDPSITVVSPSPANLSGEGLSWLDEFLTKGGGDYVDVIGYHFYFHVNPPEKIVPLIRKAREIMAKHGQGDKPLWNTEAGWSQPKPFPSDEQGAAYVARSYILNWDSGVSRFYWYAWDNRDWVSLYMTEPDIKTLKPAAKAYAEVQKWLVGAQMSACQSNGQQTWTCPLTRPGGYRGWIVWNPDRQMEFQVPENWRIKQVRELSGDRRNLRGSRIEIGPRPLLFERVAS